MRKMIGVVSTAEMMADQITTIVAQFVVHYLRMSQMIINTDSFTFTHSCSVCNQTFKLIEEFKVHSCAPYLRKRIDSLETRLKKLEDSQKENWPS